MPRPYLFTVNDNDSRSDSLGCIALADDEAAFVFGRQVIVELVHKDAKTLFAGLAMDITKGGRAVGSIPFNPSAGAENETG